MILCTSCMNELNIIYIYTYIIHITSTHYLKVSLKCSKHVLESGRCCIYAHAPNVIPLFADVRTRWLMCVYTSCKRDLTGRLTPQVLTLGVTSNFNQMQCSGSEMSFTESQSILWACHLKDSRRSPETLLVWPNIINWWHLIQQMLPVDEDLQLNLTRM